MENEEQMNNTSEINTLKQEIRKSTSQLQNSKERINNFSTGFQQAGRGFGQYGSYGFTQGGRGYNPNQRYRRNNYQNNFQCQFYCWTHGAGHSGWNCKNPAEGHQPSATFSNCMGGNNYGCFSKPRRFQFNNTSNNKPNHHHNTHAANQNHEN